MTAKLGLVAAWRAVSFAATAQVPQLLSFQGRAAVNGTNFDCAGPFKLAIVKSIGSMGLLNHRSPADTS